MIGLAFPLTSPQLLFVTTALLFAIGVFGLLRRHNPMLILMSVELMLNAGNVLLVLAAHTRNLVDAESSALIVLALGAAEAVVGLALALAVFRSRPDANADDIDEVRG
jgi:NADH-quinone oxidoreductase subunit K